MLGKVWRWLDGRKTAIGLMVVFAQDLIYRGPWLVARIHEGDVPAISAVISELLVALGSLHKAIKGAPQGS